MLPELRLSPLYWLALTRLVTGDWKPDWPALLIGAPRPAWPFDEHPAPLTVDQLDARARAVGLRRVYEPFTDEPAETFGWSFRLPTLRRHAQLVGPAAAVAVNRPVHITDDWWRLAVTHGARCRLLIAVCATPSGDPAGNADLLTATAADGRLYGTTIAVEF